MDKLERFLDNYEGKEISYNMVNDYEKFDYENDAIFQHHLKFLLKNCYNITVKEQKKKRLSQGEFREMLLERYNNKCIVSGNDCDVELTAAHIVPFNVEESYDIDNGLILTETFHKTFDKYYWSINPDTLKIEIDKKSNVGQIKRFVDMKLNIKLNPTLKDNIMKHYSIFKNKIEN
jgi:predicted restriction endonuclease